MIASCCCVPDGADRMATHSTRRDSRAVAQPPWLQFFGRLPHSRSSRRLRSSIPRQQVGGQLRGAHRRVPQGPGRDRIVEGRDVAMSSVGDEGDTTASPRWRPTSSPATWPSSPRREDMAAGLAAKAATAKIGSSSSLAPTRCDSGLVSSLNRPEGNVTGVAILTNTLAPKQLQLLQSSFRRATLASASWSTRKIRSPTPTPATCSRRDHHAAATPRAQGQ